VAINATSFFPIVCVYSSWQALSLVYRENNDFHYVEKVENNMLFENFIYITTSRIELL